MADEEKGLVQEQKKSNKGLIILLIVLVVILIFGFTGGGYYILKSNNSGSSSSSMNGGTSGEQMTSTVDPNAEFFNVEINDLVLNITTSQGREKLMKLSFTLKSTEPDIASLMETNKPEIIDLVISLISARNAEELLTVGGKELLKEELLLGINNILNRSIKDDDFQRNSIKNLFFTSFVIK